ncbi:MAG: hypothetical protein H0W11_00820 [Gemmatimonadetes bacterium]|jgi:hypothetical protein|nr:hypothetical protein [Gemmatimonadota bacterium]
MSEYVHQHGEEGGEYGVVIGFRILEVEGELYLAEAEIAPYVDQPESLGATLVFHPLEGFDPTTATEEMDWPAWPVDVDDELNRDEGQPIPDQLKSILRQLRELSDEELREYLQEARTAAEEGEQE